MRRALTDCDNLRTPTFFVNYIRGLNIIMGCYIGWIGAKRCPFAQNQLPVFLPPVRDAKSGQPR